MANPLPLHGRNTRIDTEIAHLDWSEKLKSLWFKKPKDKQYTQQEKECTVCKNKFISKGSRQIKNSKFCSRECFDLNRRKVYRPSKEQLEQDIMEMSIVQVGKKYGVSDNTIRKWIKFYNK